jgi:Bacterial archaeo-eukaryotic release factor family 10
MRLPDEANLRDLVAWDAGLGVISVYLEIDPGDRGGAWRIALRDQLDEVVEGARERDDRERRAALEATVEHIRERFAPQAPPSGRVQIGFVEVTPKPGKAGREEWFAVQHPVEPTRVADGRRPFLRPLMEILDGGRPRAIAALSTERVRIFEWRLGTIEELAERELELFALDWRERKAPQVRDPSTGQGVSSAGRDQFGQRLEENRKRFLKEIGARASRELGERARRELLCFGDGQLCEAFVAGWDQRPQRHAVDPHDVITEPAHAIGERATRKLTELDHQRALELADSLTSAALARNGAGALGPSGTARALIRGQVGHLLIEAERSLDTAALDADVLRELESATPRPGSRLDEWMVEEAILTDASVTTLRDDAAERLAEHGGVGALLRY